jgi:hypothetical protein
MTTTTYNFEKRDINGMYVHDNNPKNTLYVYKASGENTYRGILNILIPGSTFKTEQVIIQTINDLPPRLAVNLTMNNANEYTFTINKQLQSLPSSAYDLQRKPLPALPQTSQRNLPPLQLGNYPRQLPPLQGGSRTTQHKKTTRKYTNKKGQKYVVYEKNGNDYIRKKSKKTGKFYFKKL